LKNPCLFKFVGDRTSVTKSFNSFLIQTPRGISKPIFFRVNISGGRYGAMAFFRMCLVLSLLSFRKLGMVAAYSTKVWSRKGTRISKELAMLILSVLTSRSSWR